MSRRRCSLCERFERDSLRVISVPNGIFICAACVYTALDILTSEPPVFGKRPARWCLGHRWRVGRLAAI
jgi:hypothetical protein